MNKKRIVQVLVACLVTLLLSLLPAQSAERGKAVAPVLSLLLAGGGTCASGAQTVNYAGHEWQRCDDNNVYNWEAAKTYCSNLSLAGHSDWRLPTQSELRSLIVCTNGNGPIVNYPGNPFYCGDGNNGSYDSPTI